MRTPEALGPAELLPDVLQSLVSPDQVGLEEKLLSVKESSNWEEQLPMGGALGASFAANEAFEFSDKPNKAIAM